MLDRATLPLCLQEGWDQINNRCLSSFVAVLSHQSGARPLALHYTSELLVGVRQIYSDISEHCGLKAGHRPSSEALSGFGEVEEEGNLLILDCIIRWLELAANMEALEPLFDCLSSREIGCRKAATD